MTPADLYATSGLDLGLNMGQEVALAQAAALRGQAQRRRGVGRGGQTGPVGASTSLTPAPSAPAAFAPAGGAQAVNGAPGKPQGVDFTARRADLERRQSALDAPADYTQLGQYAQQRAGESHRQLVLALAAQRAGKDFAPVAQHLLRASEQARGPMQVTGGLISEGGEFVADPQFSRQRQREQIAQQIQRLDTQEQGAQQFDLQQARLTAEAAGRRDDARAREASEERRHEETIAARRETAQAAHAARGDAAAQRADAARFRGEDSMRGQWNHLSADYRIERDALNKIRSIVTPGKRLNPIELQSVMVLLNKVQDPPSVVREGEFARVAEAQGLAQKYTTQMWERIWRGDPISQEMAADIRRMGEVYGAASRNTMQKIADEYMRIANTRGYDRMSIIADPEFTGLPGSAPAPAPGGVQSAPTVFWPPPSGSVQQRASGYLQGK